MLHPFQKITEYFQINSSIFIAFITFFNALILPQIAFYSKHTYLTEINSLIFTNVIHKH